MKDDVGNTRDFSTVHTNTSSLLGGPQTLTIEDVASMAGVTIEEVRDFWVAMGFPSPRSEEKVFTENDAKLFLQWSRFMASGAIDTATARSLLRANSHLADRLGLWQVEALVEDTMRRFGLDDTAARMYVLDHIRERVDVLEDVLRHSWRRQLDALLKRMDHEISTRGHEGLQPRFPLNRSLGFVDMVSYTSSSAILGGKLVDLIGRFEQLSRDAVTYAGGRVVKMIGDAVMYIADDLETGLRVAVSLIEQLGADDQMLPVRASFVRGDVFSRSGDVFGPTVNLASRLVDIAPVGKILMDPTTAAAIAAGKAGMEYDVEEFPSATLRGFGTISPYLLTYRR